MWRFRLHRYAGDEKGVVANDEAPKYAVETLQTFELISVLKRDNRLVTVPMLKPEYRGDEDYFRFVSKEEYRPCVIQPGKYFYIQNCASNQFLTVSDDGGEIRCESREGKVDGTLFLVGVQKKQQQQQQRDNHWWFRGCKTSTSITSYGLRCIIVGPDGYLVHGFPKIVRGYLRKKNVLYGYSTKYFAIVNGELRFWEDEKHFIDCVDVARESGSLSLKDVDWATFGKTKSHVKLLFENGKTHYRFKLLKSGNIDENPFTKIKKNTAALWISSFCKLVLKINNKKQKKQPQQRDGHVVAINNENGEEKGEGEGGGGGGGGGVLAILTSEKESATSTTSFSSMSGNTIDVTKDLQQFIVDGVLRIRPCESWCELFQDINKQLIGSELLVIRLTKGEGKSRCFSYYYYSLADLQAGIMVEEVLKHQQQRNDDKEHKNHHHHPDERGDEKANHVTSDLLHHRPTEEMVIIDDDDDVKNDGDKDQRGGYTDNPHPPPPAKYRSKDGNEKEKEEEVRTSEMGGGKLTGRLRQHTSTEGEEQSRDDITRRRNRLRKDPNDNNHDRGNSLHDVTGQSTQRKGGLNTTMTTTTTTTRTCKTVITNEAAAGNDDEEQKENDKRGPRSKDDAHETKRNVKDKKEGCDKKMRHNDENRRRRRRRPTLVVESETTTRRRRDNEIDDFNNDDDNDEYTAAQTNKAQPFISPLSATIASSRSSGQNVVVSSPSANTAPIPRPSPPTTITANHTAKGEGKAGIEIEEGGEQQQQQQQQQHKAASIHEKEGTDDQEGIIVADDSNDDNNNNNNNNSSSSNNNKKHQLLPSSSPSQPHHHQQQQQIKAPKPSRLHLDCGGLRGEKGAGEKGRGGGGSRHKDRNIDQQEDLRQNHQRVPTKPVKATSMPVLLAAALLPTEHDNRRKKKIVMAQERRKKCDLNLDNTKEGQGQEEDKNHDKGGGGGGGGGGEGKNKEAELIRRLKHRLSPLLPFSRRGKGGHKSSVCMGWYTMLCIDANLQMGDNVARPVHLKLVILDNNTNNKSYDNSNDNNNSSNTSPRILSSSSSSSSSSSISIELLAFEDMTSMDPFFALQLHHCVYSSSSSSSSSSSMKTKTMMTTTKVWKVNPFTIGLEQQYRGHYRRHHHHHHHHHHDQRHHPPSRYAIILPSEDLCKIWGLQLSLAIDLGATTLRHCKNKVQQQQHLPLPLSPASSAFQCFPLILEMRTTTTPKRAFNATGDRGNACICCSGMLVVYGRLGYASFSGAIGVTRIVPLASIESAFAEESSGLTTMISTMSCGGDGGQWYSRLVVKMKGSSGGGESSLVFRSQATSITQKASDCITSLIANKRQQPPNYGNDNNNCFEGGVEERQMEEEEEEEEEKEEEEGRSHRQRLQQRQERWGSKITTRSSKGKDNDAANHHHHHLKRWRPGFIETLALVMAVEVPQFFIGIIIALLHSQVYLMTSSFQLCARLPKALFGPILSVWTMIQLAHFRIVQWIPTIASTSAFTTNVSMRGGTAATTTRPSSSARSMTIKKDKSFITEASSLRVGLSRRSYSKSSSSSSSSSSTMMMRNDGKVSADASSPTATTSTTSLLSADAHLRLQMMELATIASALGIVLLVGFDCMVMRNAQEHQEEQGGRERNLDTLPFTQVLVSISQASITATCITIVVAFWLCTLALFPTASEDEVREEEEGKEDGDNKQMKLQQEEKKK